MHFHCMHRNHVTSSSKSMKYIKEFLAGLPSVSNFHLIQPFIWFDRDVWLSFDFLNEVLCLKGLAWNVLCVFQASFSKRALFGFRAAAFEFRRFGIFILYYLFLMVVHFGKHFMFLFLNETFIFIYLKNSLRFCILKLEQKFWVSKQYN